MDSEKCLRLICPICGHRIECDLSEYDRQITRLGCEISDIMVQLRYAKLDPCRSVEWHKAALKALGIKQQQLHRLKEVRKAILESSRKAGQEE